MTINDFKAEDTALVLVDFQTGTMGWVRSTDIESLQVRSVALAKAAKALGMPVVLTTSQEENVQGPLMAELIELFPAEHAARVRRTGVVNAMDDPDFAAAVKNTGRTNILIAGITNDVCTIFPTLTMLEQGYRVAVVSDAGGSITEVGDDRHPAHGAGGSRHHRGQPDPRSTRTELGLPFWCGGVAVDLRSAANLTWQRFIRRKRPRPSVGTSSLALPTDVSFGQPPSV